MAEDHSRAARLGDALTRIEGVDLLNPVETNIVIVELEEAPEDRVYEEGPAVRLARLLREIGIVGIPVGPRRVRFVTHRDVEGDAFDRVLPRLEGLTV